MKSASRSIASLFALWLPLAHAAGPVVEVFKSPYCGCCGKWAEHMKAAGFEVKLNDVQDLGAVRKQFGIPDAQASCHSARVAGYVLEGHVPAADVRRLLKEKPKARGVAVPGMPMGSPGMEADRVDRYDTLLIGQDGRTQVFARH